MVTGNANEVTIMTRQTLSSTFLVISLLTMSGSVLAENLDGEAKWRAEIEQDNVAYSKNRIATMKIDDAVYIREGQTAYLVRKTDSREHYVWTLTQPTDASVVKVTYDGKTADLYRGDESTPASDLLSAEQPFSVSDTVDVKGGKAQIDPGVMGLRVLVFNQNNPAAAAFKGFEYFPYDASAIVTATFEPVTDAKFAGQDFRTSRDWLKRFYLAGYAIFEREGKSVRLPMYAETDDPKETKALSAFFMDELTGTETYGVGRYVDAEIESFPVNKVTIDFNYAYNPACAYSPHFNCPVAEYRLPFAMRAGAKAPSEPAVH